MKKFFLSTFVILSFALYAFSAGGKEEVSVPANIPTSASDSFSHPAMGRGMMTGGQYRNGEYIGSTADAYYGNIQVKVVISGGKISDVVFLDYPHDRRTSMMINSQAMPDLKTEAIQVQNANVDIVSGATATSEAFRQSLQSALAQAQQG